jgi:hypothetical protein
VRERLKDTGLELSQHVLHETSIFDWSNILKVHKDAFAVVTFITRVGRNSES